MARHKANERGQRGAILFGVGGALCLLGCALLGVHFFRLQKASAMVIPQNQDHVEELELDYQTGTARIRDSLSAYLGQSMTLALGDRKAIMQLSELGLGINDIELEKKSVELMDAGVPVESLEQAVAKSTRPLAIDRQSAEGHLLKLKEQLDQAPKNARLDLEKREIIKSVPGFGLEPYGSISAIEKAARKGETLVKLEGVSIPAEVTIEDLGIDDISTVISSFETRFSVAEKTRNSNLKRLASMLDGLVLQPDEEFSFNKTTGMRELEDGFKMAHVISSGEMVDGMAGGSCQISTTLHGAAFFGGLDVVKTTPHSRPSTYVEMGLDATVVAGVTDLKLRNPYDFPVVIHYTVARGVSRVEILGREKPFDKVEFERKVMERKDFRTVTREDMDIGVGNMVVDQSGYPGYKVRRTRRIYKKGKVIKSDRWNINYYPVIEYARIGINPDPNLPPPRARKAHGPKPAKGTFRMVR